MFSQAFVVLGRTSSLNYVLDAHGCVLVHGRQDTYMTFRSQVLRQTLVLLPLSY